MTIPGTSGGKVPASVLVTVIVCLTVIVVSLIGAVIYAQMQGRDATNLVLLAAGIITSSIPGVLGLARTVTVDAKIDHVDQKVDAVTHVLPDQPTGYTGPLRRSTDRKPDADGDPPHSAGTP